MAATNDNPLIIPSHNLKANFIFYIFIEKKKYIPHLAPNTESFY